MCGYMLWNLPKQCQRAVNRKDTSNKQAHAHTHTHTHTLCVCVCVPTVLFQLSPPNCFSPPPPPPLPNNNSRVCCTALEQHDRVLVEPVRRRLKQLPDVGHFRQQIHALLCVLGGGGVGGEARCHGKRGVKTNTKKQGATHIQAHTGKQASRQADTHSHTHTLTHTAQHSAAHVDEPSSDERRVWTCCARCRLGNTRAPTPPLHSTRDQTHRGPAATHRRCACCRQR